MKKPFLPAPSLLPISDCQPPGEAAAPKYPSGFIRQPELQRRVPVSRRTLYEWELRGILPVVKIGAAKLYHWQTVEAALLRLGKGGAS